MKLTASAPGKLVLSGEYAVLGGGPAIAMAVNRRARVGISDSAAGHHSVEAPGFEAVTGRFRAGHDGFEWLDGGDGFGLVEAVWTELEPDVAGSVAMELDTRAFRDPATGRKLGIGSSAALTVALAHALAAASRRAEDPVRASFRGHRQFQGGLGSGVDVACAVLGGLVEYSMDGRSGRHLDWPEGLHLAVFWLGVPADTQERLRWLEQQPARPSHDALLNESGRMAAAWAGGSARDVLAAYAEYNEALHAFSADHALGIFDAGHAELAALADSAGVVYKPCGAGGGDCGVGLADDAEALAAFTRTAPAGRALRPDIGIDADGVRVREARA